MRKLFFILLCMPLLTAQQVVGMEGIKWLFNAGDSILTSPVVHNDSILFGSANGNFYALNITDGKTLWMYGKVGKIESSPSLSDTRVYFGSDDGYLYAVWLNGTLAWKFKTGDIIRSSPALSSTMVFFGSNDGYFYALWLNGTLAWKFKTQNKVLSSPLLAYGFVYFDSTDGTAYAFNAETGKMSWEYAGKAPFASSPATINWIVYAGSDDGILYAFNAFNGSVLWKQKFPGKIQSDFVISPNNVLYFSCKDGNIYAVYAGDGSRIWNVTTGTESQSSVRYEPATGFSYFGTSDHKLYAANSTGQVVWSYETGDWVISTPLVYKGILYVGSYDGNLYAISTIRTAFTFADMNAAGSHVLINGTAYADAGIEYVQVRLNGGDWENASGTTSWNYNWETSSLNNGTYTFEARSFDALGNVESPPYPTSLVQFSSIIEEKDMVVSFPQSVVAGAPIDFQVNDTDGNPVPYPQVAIFGKNYTGDDNGFVSSDANGNPIKSDKEGDFNFTVSKEGYNTYSGTIMVVQLVNVLPYIIELSAILALLFVVLFLGAMKLIKMMKKQ